MTGPERAGVKFNDADLIGNPVRVSVSSRTLGKGEAEIKLRSADEAVFVPLAEVVADRPWHAGRVVWGADG